MKRKPKPHVWVIESRGVRRGVPYWDVADYAGEVYPSQKTAVECKKIIYGERCDNLRVAKYVREK